MALTVQGLVDKVREYGFAASGSDGLPATDPMVLGWLNGRHRKMVVRSRCYRKTVDLGTGMTVANQRDYTLPADVVELLEVQVGGMIYTRGWHSDLANGAQGFILLGGPGGLIAPEEDAAGAREVAIYPTPGDAQTLTGHAVLLPPDLVIGTDTTIKIDPEYEDALVAGAIATGLRRLEGRPDLAAGFEQEFDQGCAEYRAAVNRRYRGSGPAQIRVVGINA